MKNHRRTLLATIALCLLVIIATQCMDANGGGNDPRGLVYAGPEKCAGCHKDIHASFMGTAHNMTSSIASKKTIKGNFNSPANEYYYRPDVKVVMEERDSSLYQVAYQNNSEKRASRFDIVVGSGRKAQTFLFWEDNNIFQLPVSWSVVANNWVNSPNYPPHQVRFDRNIPAGCFECHGSYIKVTSNKTVGDRIIDDFDRNKVVYGIDCERCHGPAAKHALYHEEHPEEKKPMFITSYASLQRQQKTDMCAQCHSGLHTTLRSVFAFRPGDTLANKFFIPSAPVIDIHNLDVHANQAQLLQASQCFIQSKTLNCTSCHNIHQNERTNMAVFSQRCMNCHTTANHNFCTLHSVAQAGTSDNCIDCHMPVQASKVITLLSNGKSSPSPNMVRTHFIAVYRDSARIK